MAIVRGVQNTVLNNGSGMSRQTVSNWPGIIVFYYKLLRVLKMGVSKYLSLLSEIYNFSVIILSFSTDEIIEHRLILITLSNPVDIDIYVHGPFKLISN